MEEAAGTDKSDAELVLAARRGDTAALEGLVRRHYRAAFATALSLVGSSMDAEDVCQDAFLRALERLDTCRSPAKFRPWFLKIVRNRAHNYRDYQRVRTGQSLDDVSPACSADPVHDAVRADLRSQLERALRLLTDVQRQVLLLHDLEGQKHQEIADLLGMSTESSRQHLFVARKRMRQELGQDTASVYLHD